MRRGSLLARLGRDERGQVFAFVVTILIALVLFAAASINIGQAVTRRMLLQVVADAGAYTGASVMAQGFNTIAEQNLRIQQAWAELSSATAAFTLPPCPASDLAVAAYGLGHASLARIISRMNSLYAARAHDEARRVTEFNAVDLFPGEQLEMDERQGPSGIAPQRSLSRLVPLDEVPSGTAPAVPSPSRGYAFKSWNCIGGIPPGPQPRSASFGLWYQARPSDKPVAFVWTVTAPAIRARFFDAFFGPDAIPEMTAAAVARPVGGEIKKGRKTYVAKLTPLREVVARVYDEYFRTTRPVVH